MTAFRYYIVDDFSTVTGTNDAEQARRYAENEVVIDSRTGMEFLSSDAGDDLAIGPAEVLEDEDAGEEEEDSDGEDDEG